MPVCTDMDTRVTDGLPGKGNAYFGTDMDTQVTDGDSPGKKPPRIMKTGKAAPAVLDRSILRPLKLAGVVELPAPDLSGPAKRSDHLAAGLPDAERTGSSEDAGFSPLCATTADTLLGPLDLSEEMLILSAVNQLYSKGAKAAGIMVDLVWPQTIEENCLKACMTRIASACKVHGTAMLGGHTQISDALTRPVLSVTAIETHCGLPRNNTGANRLIRDHNGSELAVVMAQAAGLAGSLVLARACECELRRHFPSFLVDEILGWDRLLSLRTAARIGMDAGAVYMHPVSRGGIFGSLWELGEKLGCGMEIGLRDILLRQETVELTEFLGIDPYRLMGCGSLLMVCRPADVQELMKRLSQEGIAAGLIGRITREKARVLRNGEDVHYLEKPAPDSLCTALDEKEKRK